MNTRRILMALIAIASLLPLSGCGCRKSCSSCNSSNSFAPPPTPPCCDKAVPPAYLPPPGQ